jgi:hypothetical protein
MLSLDLAKYAGIFADDIQMSAPGTIKAPPCISPSMREPSKRRYLPCSNGHGGRQRTIMLAHGLRRSRRALQRIADCGLRIAAFEEGRNPARPSAVARVSGLSAC